MWTNGKNSLKMWVIQEIIIGLSREKTTCLVINEETSLMTFSGIYTKAAVLVQLNQSLEMMDDVMVPLPEKGQVLVKIQYAGLCHSQLMEIQGLRGEDKHLPHMLGHEGVGD